MSFFYQDKIKQRIFILWSVLENTITQLFVGFLVIEDIVELLKRKCG